MAVRELNTKLIPAANTRLRRQCALQIQNPALI